MNQKVGEFGSDEFQCQRNKSSLHQKSSKKLNLKKFSTNLFEDKNFQHFWSTFKENSILPSCHYISFTLNLKRKYGYHGIALFVDLFSTNNDEWLFGKGIFELVAKL